VVGVFSLPVVGMVGCADEATTKVKEEVTTPGGTTSKEVKETIKSSGSNPPTTSDGVKVDPKK
jgi:hypothetical protein